VLSLIRIKILKDTKDTDNQRIFMKSKKVVVLDKNLVRLSPPPENTRPGKLIKTFKEKLTDNNLENNDEVKSPA
jgi:hypothetical protein